VTAQLDQRLLDILACPCAEHAPLRVATPAQAESAVATSGDRASADTDFLTCTSCGRMFPIRDGIPVLLLDEAVLPETGVDGDRSAGGAS
jgi:uncharacterized protein